MENPQEFSFCRLASTPISYFLNKSQADVIGLGGYLMVLVLIALAVLVRYAVAPVDAGVPYVTFFPAVTLAAILGGHRAGLVATVLSMALISFLFYPPYYSFRIENISLSLWANSVFFIGGVIVSLAIGAMHRYRRQYQQELEETKASEACAKGLNEKLEKQIARRIRIEERMRIAAVAFETHEAIAICDPNGNFIRVNQAFQNITGYSSEEALGKNPRLLKSGRHDRAFYQNMWEELLNKGVWSGEVWDKRKSGQVYPKWLTITAVKDKHGKLSAFVSIFTDITERKQAEEEITKLAYYDALTRLPNRRLLLDRLGLALSTSARHQLHGAVLFLDMDRFKMLNDSLGHDYGDQMLVEVARRIESCIREMDSVARLGGDEFVVLLEELDEDKEKASQKAAVVAEKIRASLSASYQLDQHEYHSSPSIGICLFCGHEHTVEELLKYADMAMYKAKDKGRNAVQFYEPEMQRAVELRVALEADLRRALLEDQLRLYYQIQTDEAHRVTGAEALVRWMHPKRGMVSPAQFIPIAEDSSLILNIGTWVLETACRQLAAWSGQEQTRHLDLAVNVSARQFHLHTFVDDVLAAIRRHGVDPTRLKLELTEGVVLADVADVIAKMQALQDEGIRLSLDDFGTGYSSLSYLKRLPLDQVKIDQSFVRDIVTDPSDAIMVRTIIKLGQSFQLQVIAEGVETQDQLAFLKLNGCLAYQGYLFSKPLPIEEVELLLPKGMELSHPGS